MSNLALSGKLNLEKIAYKVGTKYKNKNFGYRIHAGVSLAQPGGVPI